MSENQQNPSNWSKLKPRVMLVIFFLLLVILITTVYVIIISIKKHGPRYYIQDFQVRNLARPLGFTNSAISCKVTLRNPNRRIAIYYASLNGTVFFKDQQLCAGSLLNTSLLQQSKNSTDISKTFYGATLNEKSRRWSEFFGERESGSVKFRLELMAVLRFRISTWKDGKHLVHVICEVKVGCDGGILPAAKGTRCHHVNSSKLE